MTIFACAEAEKASPLLKSRKAESATAKRFFILLFWFWIFPLSASFTQLQTFITQVSSDDQSYPTYPFGYCPAFDNGIPAVDDPKEMQQGDDDEYDSGEQGK